MIKRFKESMRNEHDVAEIVWSIIAAIVFLAIAQLALGMFIAATIAVWSEVF